MADQLEEARKNGEFPSARYPVSDPAIIAQELDMLRALRKARGDPARTPPPEYKRLRVQVTADVRDREAEMQRSGLGPDVFNLYEHLCKEALPDANKLHEVVYEALRDVDNSDSEELTRLDFEIISQKLVSILEDTMLEVTVGLRLRIDRMEANVAAVKAENAVLKTQIDVLTSTVAGHLGKQMAAVSGIPASLHGPLHDAICRAFKEVMVEARAGPGTPGLASPARSQAHIGADVESLNPDEMSALSLRPRKLRGSRPAFMKEYAKKFWAGKLNADNPASGKPADRFTEDDVYHPQNV